MSRPPRPSETVIFEIGAWYETTELAHWWGYSLKAFSSQRFWDNMDLLGVTITPLLRLPEDSFLLLPTKADEFD